MVTHVTGWMRNLGDPNERVAFEVAVDRPEGAQAIATGIADQFSPALQELSVGDAHYAFRIEFATPLTPDERDRLIVRPSHSDIPLELAPQLQGFVDERSIHHVAGWVRNRSDPTERVRFEVVLSDLDGDHVLASGLANEPNPVLEQLGVGDAAYGFRVLFPEPLSEAERDRVVVRPAGATAPLELSPTAIDQLPVPVQLPAAIRAPVQGYVEERLTTHVTGWMRNLDDPTERVAFEVAVDRPEGAQVIATGIADQFSPALQELSVGDARYGFRIVFPTPLTPDECDRLIVRPSRSDIPLELAPQLQGYIDERSIHHVAGWVRNRSDPAERVRFQVVLAGLDGDQVLTSGLANEPSPVLEQLAVGDSAYGFRVLFPEPLSEAERDRVFVRPAGATAPLELSPALATVFEPVSHVAMDIVNNCNLRCPFCVYDYSNTRNTRVMSEATFDSALRLIPFVTDGNFWLSCLHEATMHPELMRFIDRIPRQWRRKVMYTTNLARPMPDAYFDALAESGLHHLNISLESLDPEIYERMRKGARWRIFAKNWDRLLQAIRAGSNPPRLRYNIMAYRTNRAEIPDLVKYLRDERLAWQVEVRHTFDVEHIPGDFREAEFLDDDGWAWLAEQLKAYAAEEVLLIPPPVPDTPAQPQVTETVRPDVVPRLVTRPLNIRMEWDGAMTVYGEWTGLTGVREHEQFVVTNVHHLRDPRRFLTSL